MDCAPSAGRLDLASSVSTLCEHPTNGTLLREKRYVELIGAGLDELRVSLDAADAKSYAMVRVFDERVLG